MGNDLTEDKIILGKLIRDLDSKIFILNKKIDILHRFLSREIDDDKMRIEWG